MAMSWFPAVYIVNLYSVKVHFRQDCEWSVPVLSVIENDWFLKKTTEGHIEKKKKNQTSDIFI